MIFGYTRDGGEWKTVVYFDNLVTNIEFKVSEYVLPMVLGRLNDERPVYIDLIKMPHILIAGSTGTGKTMLLQTFIMSILTKQIKDKYKLTLVDTQGINFSCWNKVADVIVGADDAISTLESIRDEMERRYLDGNSENMLYNIVIIDELADLIGVGDDKAVRLINSIAQKGRAAGVHLIMATQRQDEIPNDILDVIPTKISFFANSIVESKRFLGAAGAENLSHFGDILFSDMGRKPIRVFTPWVQGSDIKDTFFRYKAQCY